MPTCPSPVIRAMAASRQRPENTPDRRQARSYGIISPRIMMMRRGRGNPARVPPYQGGPRMIRLYDPTAEPRAVAAKLAPRLAGLQGKRIGILDNGKANAGTLMLAVARRLQESHGAGEIVKREKPVAGPPSPEALEALAQCDLTLVG